MATADSALQTIARALWDPNPTSDEKSERFLAAALGYPSSWHVVRKIEEDKRNDKETTTSSLSDANAGGDPSSANNNQKRILIVDRIYAGNPSEGVDMWFNHHAAQAAAVEWVEGESTGYDKKGGQLLPRKPKFQKNDQVKVLYEGEWMPATIQKRTERKEGFRYSVFYPQDNATQTQVHEDDIQLLDDPHKAAEDIGLDSTWQAKMVGKKFKFFSPDGKTFTSQNAALKHKKKLDKGETPSKRKKKDEPKEPELSEGDPPWRTTGHEYIGRRILFKSEHQKSATRTVTIEQKGTIMGWISETDVDKNGEPGFVSEKSGKPANLFEVVFDDEPSHPYAPLLLDRQDMEQWEVEDWLLPPDEEGPPNKKRKK
jgi:hypothetical protein